MTSEIQQMIESVDQKLYEAKNTGATSASGEGELGRMAR